MPLTPEQVQFFALSWYAAWNAHDIDAIMAHYDAAIEHSSPFIKRYNGTDDPSIKGIAGVRRLFRGPCSATRRSASIRCT